MDVLLPILDFVLPVGIAILTIVAVALAKKYIGKLGIERSEKTDAMLEKYVPMAVSFVERAAKTAIAAGQEKIPSESKKSMAVKAVLAELKQSGIKDVGEDLIAARVEAWLEDHDPKLPGTSGQGDSTTV